MAGTGTGYSGIVGAKKEAAYRTALAMDTRLPILNESLTDAIKMIEQETITGSPGRDILDAGPISVSGSVETELRYPTANSGRTLFFGNDLLMALAMGTCTWNAGSVTNILKLADDLDKFCTIAVHKKIAVWEFVSCKFKGFKITGKAGDIWRATHDVVCYSVVRGDPSSGGQVNKQANFDALTVVAALRALFGYATFYLAPMNTNWTAALATYKIGLSDFTLDSPLGLTDSEFSSPDAAAGHTDPRLTIEPVRGEFRKPSIECTLPRYQDQASGAYQWGTQLQVWKDAMTALQLYVLIQPPSDNTRIITMKFPKLYVTDLKTNIAGAPPMTTKMKLNPVRGNSLNTILVDAASVAIAEEFVIEFKNSNDAAAEYGRNATIF